LANGILRAGAQYFTAPAAVTLRVIRHFRRQGGGIRGFGHPFAYFGSGFQGLDVHRVIHNREGFVIGVLDPGVGYPLDVGGAVKTYGGVKGSRIGDQVVLSSL